MESFKTFMNESESAFRIPVLYEHNNPINFIPFGKVPNDIMFDRITMKYAAIVASAYGMSLGDIGLAASQSSGETLAGTIRSDVKYSKTGFARVKAKMEYFFNQFLPDTIQFKYIDYDRELNVAMGRARLASATAFKSFMDMKAFSPQEIRNQAIADGLFTITIPDELPPESEFPEPEPVAGAFGKPAAPGAAGKKKKTPKEPEAVGNPKPASQGGEGEFNARSLTEGDVQISVAKMVEAMPTFETYLNAAGEDNREIAKLELKSEPLVVEYLSEIGKITGSQELVDKIFGETIGILDEYALDTGSELPYDTMVETLMSRVYK